MEDAAKETDYVHADLLVAGVSMAYFNLTHVLGKHGMITHASYKDSKIYRQVAVANKFKVMTLVLQSGHDLTTLVFNITGHQNSTNSTFKVCVFMVMHFL